MIDKRAISFIRAFNERMPWKSFVAEALPLFESFLELWHRTAADSPLPPELGMEKRVCAARLAAIFRRLHCNDEGNYYTVLGLLPGAPPDLVHRRWKELMLLYHPDRNKDKGAMECAKRINEAYSVLKNPAGRMLYDSRLKEREKRPKKNQPPGKTVHPPSVPAVFRGRAAKGIIAASMVISALFVADIFLENRPLKTSSQPLFRETESGGAQAQPVPRGVTRETTIRPKETSLKASLKNTGKRTEETAAPRRDRASEKRDREKEEEAEASPAPQALESKDASKRLRTEVDLFIRSYIRAYENGDAAGLVSHFSRSAIENDRMRYKEISDFYQGRIQGKKFHYDLGETDIQRHGAYLSASASYSITPLYATAEQPVQGRIRWVLHREKGGLRIVRVDYDEW
ncbi:MAG: DnaJ domain-containing protein [Nitrospirales bacterium]|nr:DnaJ domain-containing protein [Nitrospirales bacterium]